MVDSKSEYNTPEYWQRLGEFVQQFADAELETHLMLWAMTDRDERIPAAVFPDNMRLDDAITSLRRLFPFRAASVEGVRVCHRVLDQLKLINGVRNKLLHNGATFTETGAVVVARLAARRKGEENAKQHPVPAQALAAMANDCRTISGVMFALSVLSMDKAEDIVRHYDFENWEYRPERFR